jgi:hypothetical protein
MGRCTFLTALALFAVLPALALADIPGGPPVAPPDCPPGTRLEGPYRYWRCVPVAPPEPAVPGVHDPAHVEPTPTPPPEEASSPEPTGAPTVPASAAPEGEGWHTTSGCTVVPRSSGGAACVLVALIGLAARRRAR